MIQAQQAITPVKITILEAKIEPLSNIAEQIEPMAEAAKFIYLLQVVFKGQTYIVRKDLSELVDFMQEIDKLYNGFVDVYIS